MKLFSQQLATFINFQNPGGDCLVVSSLFSSFKSSWIRSKPSIMRIAMRTSVGLSQKCCGRSATSLPLVTDSGRELVEAVKEKQPSLTIAAMHLKDMKAIDALLECAEIEPTPSIVISEKADLEEVEEALKDHVMAYLVSPVLLNDLRPTIYLVVQRFEQFRELREENTELKDALEMRKWVERAKGVLMNKHGIEEDVAYRKLRKLATDRRKKIGEVARIIVEAEQMLKG